MIVVNSIAVASVRLPLPAPVQLGSLTIKFRDYVVLRLMLSDGAVGFAYGYDRGLPLFELCTRAVQSYVGEPATDRNRLRKTAMGVTPAPRAAMTRGASLCDIALWDAWCQSCSLPLWAALGASRNQVPVMPVIGYGMTTDVAAEEAASLAAQGYQILKCMIDGRDIKTDRLLMEMVTEAVPDGVRIGIDAHWSWTTVTEALPWCRAAEQVEALFLEDPFAPTQVHTIAELSTRTNVPLAVGEDVIDLHAFRDLAAAGGLLRVDASVSGGISGTLDALALARSFGRPVIPHVFAGLHGHFGFIDDSVICVEMISQRVAADPIDNFVLERPHIVSGKLQAPRAPGVGTALDWEGLTPFMTRKEECKA